MNRSDPNKMFILAAKRGDMGGLERLIESGVELTTTDSQGWTALFHAAHRGDVLMLERLLQAGMDVNEGENSGFTALSSAVLGRHVRAVRFLLSAGAIVRTAGGYGLTGLVQVARIPQERREQILQLLQKAETKEQA